MGQVVGKIPCPIAALLGEVEEADLCKQATGKKKYYIRSKTGTLQTVTELGQKYVNRLIESGVARMLEPGPEQDEAVAEKAEEATKVIQETRREASKLKQSDDKKPDESLSKGNQEPKGVGFWQNFWSDDNE